MPWLELKSTGTAGDGWGGHSKSFAKMELNPLPLSVLKPPSASLLQTWSLLLPLESALSLREASRGTVISLIWNLERLY